MGDAWELSAKLCPLCGWRLYYCLRIDEVACKKCRWEASYLTLIDGRFPLVIAEYHRRLALGWRLPLCEWFRLEWLFDAEKAAVLNYEYAVIDGATREVKAD
jgi:hypothetical protein